MGHRRPRPWRWRRAPRRDGRDISSRWATVHGRVELHLGRRQGHRHHRGAVGPIGRRPVDRFDRRPADLDAGRRAPCRPRRRRRRCTPARTPRRRPGRGTRARARRRPPSRATPWATVNDGATGTHGAVEEQGVGERRRRRAGTARGAAPPPCARRGAAHRRQQRAVRRARTEHVERRRAGRPRTPRAFTSPMRCSLASLVGPTGGERDVRPAAAPRQCVERAGQERGRRPRGGAASSSDDIAVGGVGCVGAAARQPAAGRTGRGCRRRSGSSRAR